MPRTPSTPHRRGLRLATLALVSVFVAIALWAVACGSNGGNGTFSPAPTSTTFDSGPPPPALDDAGGHFTLDAGTSVLLVSPAASTLLVSGPGVTRQFTAVLQGTTTPVTASWSVDLPQVGTIDANGLFTATGQLGGLVTVSAQTASAHGATTLTVDLQIVDDSIDAGAGVIAALRDGGSADPSFTWLYPYDQTVFPRQLTSPTLQFGGEPASYLRVHVTSTTMDYETFVGPSSPARATLSAAAWTTITESAAPGAPLTVQATKLSASGVTGPATETWTIAQGSLKGTVYYNTYDSPLAYGNGAVMRIKPGSNAEVLLGGPTGCHVCHAVSANGSTLVAMGADDDPTNDGGYTGDDPYFYKLGASYDLSQDAGILHAEPDPAFAFGALSPDGTRLLSCGSMAGQSPPNLPGLGEVGVTDGGSGDRPSRLYDPRDGGVLAAPGFDGVVAHALMPAFSPDGTKIVFNHFDTGVGHSLAVMTYASTSGSFSGLTDVVTEDAGPAPTDGGPNPTPYLGWPYFLPDSQTVVFNTVNYADYATWNDYGNEPLHFGDLFAVDVPSKIVTPLDALNGYASGAIYLPYGAAEAHLNYEPTVLPVAVGGYYWVVFTSRREYGNTITNASDPGHDAGAGPFETHPATRKKLWVAAIDLNIVPGQDPSHPPFYLDGQEALAGNMRGFWALDPCVQTGTSCSSGDQCCSGFCRQTAGTDGGELLSCVPQPTGCSQEYEKCTTAADCCGVAAGYVCVNGFCAQPAPH